MRGKNRIVIVYITILALIIALLVGTHVLLDRVRSQQDGTALVINVAGRQRMLSQRVTLFAGEFIRTGAPSDRDNLQDAIDFMQAQHAMLTTPPEGSIFEARLTPPLLALYEEQGLNEEVESFLASARSLASEEPEDPTQALEHLLDLATHQLLEQLDQAVYLYQADSEKAVASIHRLQDTTFAFLMFSLLLEALLIFRPMLRFTNRMYHLAMTDDLTGLPNRRSFMTACRKHIADTQRAPSRLAVLILDIDNFKSINDRYGHDVGDIVLANVAKVLREQARKQDLIGRLGGEEFGLMFTDITATQAESASKRLIACVASSEIVLSSGGTLNITMSGGLTMLESGEDLSAVIKRADLLLYQAKRAGKARIEHSRKP